MIEDLENLTKNGWEKSADGVAIKKTFIFPDFIEALGWMVKAGVCAENPNASRTCGCGESFAV